MSETQTWFRVDKFKNSIEEIEVDRVTDKTVRPKNGNTEYKESNYHFWTSTRQQAKDRIIATAESRLASARREVEIWALEVEKAKSL